MLTSGNLLKSRGEIFYNRIDSSEDEWSLTCYESGFVLLSKVAKKEI